MYRGGNEKRQKLFLKPGFLFLKNILKFLDDDSSIVKEENAEDEGASTSYIYNNPYLSMSIQQQRSRLPIFKVFFIFNNIFS